MLIRIAEPDSSSRTLRGLYAPGDFWPLDQFGIEHVNRVSPLQLRRDTVDDLVDLVLTLWRITGGVGRRSSQLRCISVT